MEVKGKTRPHFDEIDIIKGIAMLMVIYGHSFATFPIDIKAGFSNDIQRCITSFDLGLFFCASGFLFSLKDSWLVFLKKKAQRIVVPYIFFCCLDVTARHLFASFTKSHKLENIFFVILNGEQYWFLHTLFFILILMKLLNGKQMLGIPLLLLTIILSLTSIRSCKILHLGNIIIFFPYFYMGYLMRLHYVHLKNYLSFLPLTVLFLMLAIISYYFGKHSPVVIYYVYPVISILFVWGISLKINHYLPRLKTILSHFGKYSLQYYLNHLLIMLVAFYVTYYISHFGGIRIPIIHLLSCFLSAIAISYAMLVVEKQSKYLRMLCGL